MAEVINIEKTPKIGMSSAIKEGIVALFRNWRIFLKMQLFGIVFPFLIFCLIYFSDFFEMAFSHANMAYVYIQCFYYFLIFYSFIYFIVGINAVSYLAKDIYENKPIKKPTDYFGYVQFHIKSYMKFYFFTFFLYIIFLAILMCITKIIPLSDLIAGSMPFYLIFLTMTGIFWAYQDKTKPIKVFLDAIKTFFSKPYLLFLFAFNVSLFLDLYYLIRSIDYIPFITLLFCYSILIYAISFIFTRVYFEIKK